MSGWHEIVNAEDINTLQSFYGGFHDSCIKELKYLSGAGVNDKRAMFSGEAKDRIVDVVFQRQGLPITIELRFVGMRKMNIVGWQQNYFCDISDCYLAIHKDLIPGLDDDLIVWADNVGFDPKNVLNRKVLQEPDTSFIVAEKLLWREL